MTEIKGWVLGAGCWVLAACAGESAPAERDAGREGGLTVPDRTIDVITDDPGRCLPARWPLAADGTADCTIWTAHEASDCACDSANRSPAVAAAAKSVRQRAGSMGYCDQPGSPDCDALCICEDVEASGAALTSCLADEEGDDGWCYVDPERGPGTLTTPCQTDASAVVRFMGRARFRPDERGFFACGY